MKVLLDEVQGSNVRALLWFRELNGVHWLLFKNITTSDGISSNENNHTCLSDGCTLGDSLAPKCGHLDERQCMKF